MVNLDPSQDSNAEELLGSLGKELVLSNLQDGIWQEENRIMKETR